MRMKKPADSGLPCVDAVANAQGFGSSCCE